MESPLGGLLLEISLKNFRTCLLKRDRFMQ